MRSAFLLGSRSLHRTWSALAIVAVLATWGAASPAHAQTAQFSYAITTLGGGFSQPEDVAVDADGNVYVADGPGSGPRVKEIPVGCVSSSCVVPLGGVPLHGGFRFSVPTGVTVDANGNVYVADYSLQEVLKMTPGCNSSSCVEPLGGNAFVNQHPDSVAVDANGNVFVSDFGSATGVGGTVSEIPANCISRANNATCVIPLGGGFLNPDGVAVDGSGNVYVGDAGNNAVKEISTTCINGTNDASCVVSLGGGFGFNDSTGVALDASGNVYVADNGNSAVREIPSGCTTAGCVLTLGGGFVRPNGVAVGSSGNVYVADTDVNDPVVKEIELHGVDFGTEPVKTRSAAQTLTFTFTAPGTLAATPYEALTMGAPNLDFNAVPGRPATACVTGHTYNTGDTCTVTVTFAPLYAGERKGAVVLYGSTGAAIATGYIYGTGTGPQAAFDRDPATLDSTTALGSGFSQPTGVAVDGGGNVYVADFGHGAVKEIPPGCTAQKYTATSCSVATLGGGFGSPTGVAVDGAGNVYVADPQPGNSTVKEIPAGCTTAGCVLTLGSGFTSPTGVAVDGAGNIYIADAANGVKEIPSGCASSSCIMGLGSGFNSPKGIAVDGSGNVFVADSGNNAVKEMPPDCTSASCVVKVLGGGFSSPVGVAVGGSGNVFVADSGNNAVKEIPAGCTTAGCVLTLGSGFSQPYGVAVDGGGNVFVASYGDSTVKEIARATPPALSFASTNINATSSDSPQTVTVENIGNMPLAFPVPTSGNNPSIAANFVFDNSTTCPTLDPSSAPGTLASGASCNLAVDFEPTAAGTINGTANITDNNLNAAAPGYVTQQISLSGIGLQPVTQLVFAPAVPSTLTAGGNAGTVTVDEQDSTGATVTTATDSITLTVTGPNSYSQTYTATASAGVATFDLSSAALNAAGSYTYTASSGSFTHAVATQTVSAAAADTITAVSGGGQSAAIGTAFANTLVVKVADSFGNPIAGATVMFAAPTSGASATLSAPAVTDSNGETSVTVTANGVASATPYTVTASVSGVSGTAAFSLTNTKATPVVAWAAPPSISYGTALGATQLDATATFNGTAVPGAFTYTPTSGTVLEVGSHTVSVQFTPKDTTDFVTPGPTTVTITVVKTTLTVTATDASRAYGAANPAFTGTVAGAVNGDAFTESFTTTATQTSNAGSYPIVPSVAGANLANYAVTTTKGVFTVTQAASATTLQASAGSIVTGQSLTLTAKVTDTSAGSTGTPTGTVNFYDGATLLGTGALSDGVATYTTSTLAAGATHVLSATYTGSTNFTGSTSGTTIPIAVEAPDFTFTGTGNSNQTVMPGGAATFSASISPANSVYPSSVSFTAVGLPAGATATFSPSMIAANGGPHTVTMTIQTANPATTAKNRNPFERGGAGIVLGFLFFPLLGFRRVRKALRSRDMVMILLLAASLAGIASLSGCGAPDGFNSQGAKSYTVAVTATSGSVQHSFDVNLNVR